MQSECNTPSILSLPGLNIQNPWAEMIVSGKKKIETRFYPIPKHLVGIPLVIIETPGLNSNIKRRAIGIVIFEKSFLYLTKKSFQQDEALHLVSKNDPLFGWKSGKRKWGWLVQKTYSISWSLPESFKSGICYSRKVPINLNVERIVLKNDY